MKNLTVVVHVAVIVLSVQMATATVLSFEEIHGSYTGKTIGFTNYGGLIWSNVLASRQTLSDGCTGWVTGITDGITAGISTFPLSGIYTVGVSAPADMMYTFTGSYITAFANNYQPVELFGYRPGDVGYSNLANPGLPTFHITIIADTASATGTFNPPPGGATPTFYTANFTGIDRLVMVSHSGFDSIWGGGSHANSFALDEFDMEGPIPVPEPAALALFVLGGTALLRRRRRRI